MGLKDLISIVLLVAFHLIIYYEVPYELFDPAICKFAFLFNMLIAYFITDAVRDKNEKADLWILWLFGIICINGFIAMIAWAVPEMIPFLICCIGFGVMTGIHLNMRVPAEKVSKFLHRQLSVDKLDKIFDPDKEKRKEKEQEDNDEGFAPGFGGFFICKRGLQFFMRWIQSEFTQIKFALMAQIKLVLSGQLNEPLNIEQVTRLTKWLMSILENRRIKIINVCGQHLDAYIRMAVMEVAMQQKRKREDICANIGTLHTHKILPGRRNRHSISRDKLNDLTLHNPQLMIALGDIDPTTRFLWQQSHIISISFPRNGTMGNHVSSKVLQDHLNMGISQMIEGSLPAASTYDQCIQMLELKRHLDSIAHRFISSFKATVTTWVQGVFNLDERIRLAGQSQFITT